MALLNARAMVNYEAGTVRTRAGLECLGQKGEAGGGSRARGRGPKSRGQQRNWRIVVPGMPCSTGRVLPPAGCFSLPAPRPRPRPRPRPSGPMRHHARLPYTSRSGAVAAPRPLLGAKTGRNRPLGPFFSPRICACAECAGVLGEEGGWRGARAARKTAIPRCWRRDRPRMAPALHRHRRLRPAGRPAGPNTCPGGQAGGMQRAPAAARPRRAG